MIVNVMVMVKVKVKVKVKVPLLRYFTLYIDKKAIVNKKITKMSSTYLDLVNTSSPSTKYSKKGVDKKVL